MNVIAGVTIVYAANRYIHLSFIINMSFVCDIKALCCGNYISSKIVILLYHLTADAESTKNTCVECIQKK